MLNSQQIVYYIHFYEILCVCMPGLVFYLYIVTAAAWPRIMLCAAMSGSFSESSLVQFPKESLYRLSFGNCTNDLGG